MYRSSGGAVAGGGAVGGLATTGAPILLSIILAVAFLVTGLLLLRWGKVRRHSA
jgi:hypothetical protein